MGDDFFYSVTDTWADQAFYAADWLWWRSWFSMVALLAISQRWLNKPSKALSYMTEAVFPWYILY